MAGGNLKWNEQAILTLSSSIAALVNNGGGLANATANLDVRTGGNAAEMYSANFELTVQWATVTNIVSGTLVGELYLVPCLDGGGTNFGTVDIANASTDYIQPTCYVGPFVNTLHAPATGTNYIIPLLGIDLQPLLYRPYIINRSGQTWTANATLKVVSAMGQYT